MDSNKEITKKQLLKAIDELQRHPQDRVRILGDLGISAVGAGLGAAAAGTIATIAGASSIPMLTTAASWLGVTAVAATPIGWTIGIAAAGGALAYGISRLIRDGGMSEGKKKELLQIYQERLREMQFKENTAQVTISDRNRFISSLRELIEKGAITPNKAFQLIEVVEKGLMPISEAYALISAILRD